MNKNLHTVKYILSDILMACGSWTLFYVFRKVYIESVKFGYEIPIEFNNNFYLGLTFIPIFWIASYYITGYYKDIYRKSRLNELGQTFFISLVGVTIIFFVLILDDEISSYKNYYSSFFSLLSLHFFMTYIPRLILTSYTNFRIHKGIIGFKTIIVGGNEKALELYHEIKAQQRTSGNKFVGFISVIEQDIYCIESELQHMGHITDIREIISDNKIEEVIVAIESSEHGRLSSLITMLEEKNVVIKVIPDMYDILTGKVKMAAIYGAPLIQISHDLMPIWQFHLKRVIDVFGAICGLILLSPLFLFLILGVKFTSKGPVFYSHERIGKYGKPFTIYKFRSMFVDSEQNGPALSSKNDSRITRFGKLLRRSRLDELPQFYNVLIGDMSLVGPRPERQFYIDQIVKTAPHFTHLHKVRPGITSWGQVKFGYAENVEEMIERLKYDIIYIENMSLFVDFKILIYTVLIILKAKGK